MHTEKSSGMIVYREGGNTLQFLFLKRREGFLDFPKGHIEKGETEVDSAIRETREETGLELNPDTSFRYNQEYFYTLRGETVKKRVIMFLGRCRENCDVEISWEHEGFQWLTYDDAMKQLSFKNQKEMLTKAMDHINASVS